MAKKKIYDILPPEVARKVEDTIESLAAPAVPKKTVRRKKAAHKPVGKKAERRFPLKETLIGGSILLLLLAFYLYNSLQRADVQIKPAMESVSLEESVKADASTVAVSVPDRVIPARYVEFIQEGRQEFAATGTASNDGKATGVITVYNKTTPSTPVSLKVGTHFLSDSGKYFITLEKITIPAMKGKTAGSVTVRVQAEEAGEEHNIGPSKFSVPKLSGTIYYYSIWGESKDDMSGGYSGTVKKVTAQDLSRTEDELIQKLTNEAQDGLKGKIGQDELIAENGIAVASMESSASVKEGGIAGTFTQTAKVKAWTVAIKKKDVEEFAARKISSKLQEGKVVFEPSMRVTAVKDSADAAKGMMNFTMRAEAQAYYPVDTQDISQLAPGKSAEQLRNMITDKYGQAVEGIDVGLWPFWTKKVPYRSDKINVSLDFE